MSVQQVGHTSTTVGQFSHIVQRSHILCDTAHRLTHFNVECHILRRDCWLSSTNTLIITVFSSACLSLIEVFIVFLSHTIPVIVDIFPKVVNSLLNLLIKVLLSLSRNVIYVFIDVMCASMLNVFVHNVTFVSAWVYTRHSYLPQCLVELCVFLWYSYYCVFTLSYNFAAFIYTRYRT